jgi:hypothetical protein
LEDWEICRLCTLENPPGVFASLMIRARYVGSVTHKSASRCELAILDNAYQQIKGKLDKRGTGLSDRVAGIANLEERMDDVRLLKAT